MDESIREIREKRENRIEKQKTQNNLQSVRMSHSWPS